MTFGWSFLSLWDDAFEKICDVILNQDQPDDLYRLIGNIPESLSKTAIDNRLPPEEIISELNAISLLLFKSQDRQVARLNAILYENLSDVFEHFHDMNHRLSGATDGKWAFSVAQALADFAADIGRFSLSGKLKIDFGYAKKLVGLATGIHYSHISTPHGENWLKSYEDLKTLEKENSDLQHEITYAFGTFAWFLARKGKHNFGGVAVGELSAISTKVAVLQYNNRDKLRRWYSWWFNPEGKRGAWSSRIDHDIRESLLVRIAIGPVATEDLLPLSLLENGGATDEFIKDLEQTYTLMKSMSLSAGVEFDSAKATILAARDEVMRRWNEKIRGSQSLSEQKIKLTNESFAKTLLEQDPAGSLYQIKETKDSTFKASHYVGVYTVQEKEWFLDNTGYASYSVHGMGSSWAESIILGRESLLLEKLKEKLNPKAVAVGDLPKILQHIQDELSDEFVMIHHALSIPWRLKQEFFKGKQQSQMNEPAFVPGQIFKIGKVKVFSARRLEKGQFVVFPKSAFTWDTKEICRAPRISLIDPNSEEGRAVKKQYPEMDLDMKMIIEARELGTMQLNQKEFARAEGWQVQVDEEKDLY